MGQTRCTQIITQPSVDFAHQTRFTFTRFRLHKMNTATMAESISKMTSLVGSVSYQQSRFSSRNTSHGFQPPSINHSISTSHSVVDLIRSFQLDSLPRNFKYGDNHQIPETLRSVRKVTKANQTSRFQSYPATCC